MMSPLTQQMGHLSLGSAGTVSANQHFSHYGLIRVALFLQNLLI